MALKILNPDDEFDYIFMTEQSIHQTKINNISETPKFIVSFAWIKYRIDDITGDIVYDHTSVNTFYDNDYVTSAIEHQISGDETYFNAHTANQAVVAHIISEATSYNLEFV